MIARPVECPPFTRVARRMRIGRESAPRLTEPAPDDALFNRVASVMRGRGESLHRCPQSSTWFRHLGAVYVVESQSRSLVAVHVDLDAKAREMSAAPHCGCTT